MQKGDCAEHFVEYDQGSGHQRARLQHGGGGKNRGINMIGQHGPLPAHCLRRNRAFHGAQAQTDENLYQLAIPLLANEFVR